MPLQRSETYTTTGTKGSWNCDPSIAAFSLNIVCILSAGTVDYKLQYSYDTLDNPVLTDSDATWIDSDDIPASTAGTAEANFNTPIARIRVVIAALSGGTLTMKMLQGMSVN